MCIYDYHGLILTRIAVEAEVAISPATTISHRNQGGAQFRRVIPYALTVPKSFAGPVTALSTATYQRRGICPAGITRSLPLPNLGIAGPRQPHLESSPSHSDCITRRRPLKSPACLQRLVSSPQNSLRDGVPPRSLVRVVASACHSTLTLTTVRSYRDYPKADRRRRRTP
jgi:hypothetical protein